MSSLLHVYTNHSMVTHKSLLENVRYFVNQTNFVPGLNNFTSKKVFFQKFCSTNQNFRKFFFHIYGKLIVWPLVAFGTSFWKNLIFIIHFQELLKDNKKSINGILWFIMNQMSGQHCMRIIKLTNSSSFILQVVCLSP